jgi:hypothetical protein
MRAAKVALIALVLAVAGVSSAAAQNMVYPLRELEASRREGVEHDRRLKQWSIEQRRKDKARAATNVRDDAARDAVSRPSKKVPVEPAPRP